VDRKYSDDRVYPRNQVHGKSPDFKLTIISLHRKYNGLEVKEFLGGKSGLVTKKLKNYQRKKMIL